MALQPLQFVQPLRLVDELCVRVAGVGYGVVRRFHLARLEDVLDPLEGHCDEPRVRYRQQVAERLDAPLLHQVTDLLGCASAGGVAERPGRLLLDVKLGRLQQLHEGGHHVRLDHCLDLLARACGDVGDGPARLFANTLFGGGEELQQLGQHAAVDDRLRLHVVPRHDVARRAQRGCLYAGVRLPHQLHDTRADASVQDCLNLFVGSV
mmetsp:Transcript_19245/g.44944  ORF Transcript_19245/g.44944 Transcript_19245/m.44944 type:complete len:208 (-) Transcript_19245:904-1527(-)